MKKLKGLLTFVILLALIAGAGATIIRFLPLSIELVGEDTVTVEINTSYQDAGAINRSTGEKITGIPGWMQPMSASLTETHTCIFLKSRATRKMLDAV